MTSAQGDIAGVLEGTTCLSSVLCLVPKNHTTHAARGCCGQEPQRERTELWLEAAGAGGTMLPELLGSLWSLVSALEPLNCEC